MTEPSRLNRRTVLGAGAAGIAVVGAGGWGVTRLLSDSSASDRVLIGPQSRRVVVAEQARQTTGRTVARTLTAAPARVDLGGRFVDTWVYDETLPGPEIRVRAGDRLKVTVRNELPDSTSVHWHGLALRNDMDGVPTITQGTIGSSGLFTYDFIVPDPGTYWFHPHVGVQLDTGLYAPLIVEDPAEPGDYDDEIVLVLDDWTHGVGRAPDDILADFAANGMGSMTGMSDMDMSSDVSSKNPLGTDTGDVAYPIHLINGRQPSSPQVLRSRPGRRLRLRIINAAADTAYRFAIGDHRLTVTHTDGFPVRPVTACNASGRPSSCARCSQGWPSPVLAYTVPSGRRRRAPRLRPQLTSCISGASGIGVKLRPPSPLSASPCSVVATITSGSSGLTAKSAIGSVVRVSQVRSSSLTRNSPVIAFRP